jgi:hypothetical protein
MHIIITATSTHANVKLCALLVCPRAALSCCALQDSWFNTLKLKLPADAGFEIQMRYGR